MENPINGLFGGSPILGNHHMAEFFQGTLRNLEWLWSFECPTIPHFHVDSGFYIVGPGESCPTAWPNQSSLYPWNPKESSHLQGWTIGPSYWRLLSPISFGDIQGSSRHFWANIKDRLFFTDLRKGPFKSTAADSPYCGSEWRIHLVWD